MQALSSPILFSEASAGESGVRRLSRWEAYTLAIFFVGLIGLFGYFTRDFSMTALYLGPVALAAWYGGRTSGWATGLMSAAAWQVGELWAYPARAHAFIPYWNGAVVLIIYGVVVQLLCALRDLQTVLAERSDLRTLSLAEIHHRVKNNLQIISSLLLLQAEKVTGRADRMVFEECRERIRSMEDLHEQLYSGRPGLELDFAVHLKELAAMLIHCHTPPECGLTLQVDVEPLPLDLDTSIPLGLIAHELILNSLKHAFTERAAGTMRIGLHRQDHVLLSVSDDGRGPPSLPGAETNRRLGLELVHAMAQQIDGKALIGNRPNGGTRATISFQYPSRWEKSDFLKHFGNRHR